MSSNVNDPMDPSASTSRGLPPLPADQRSASSRENEPTAAHAPDPSSSAPRPVTISTTVQEPPSNLNPIVESPVPGYPAAHFNDLRGNGRSASHIHRVDVPAEDRVGVGAHGRHTTGRTPSTYSIRTPRRISTFDDGGRYSAASPQPLSGSENGGPIPRRRSTLDDGLAHHPGPGSDLGQRMSVRRSQVVLGQGDGGAPGPGGVGWIVPLDPDEKTKASIITTRLTVRDRIAPTLQLAQAERDKYAMKAKMSGYALNAAIGAQVVLGALTTGLSAALSGDQVRVVTATLGGLSTIAASYLARARGSNEPELSISRTKDLEQFIRECQAFQLDYGHLFGVDHVDNPDGTKNEEEGTPMEKFLDGRLGELRDKFENMLGNISGERKLQEPLGSLHKTAV